MPWVRLEDGFTTHPKVVGLSDAAFRLHVHALCYAAEKLTDGVVPIGWLTGGRGRVPKAAEQLAGAGLWDKDAAGYRIHDYLEYQPSRDEVIAARLEKSAIRAAAGRLGGIASGRARGSKTGSKREAKQEANAKQTASKTEAPFPIPKELDESKNDSSVETQTPRALFALHNRLFLARYERKPLYDGAKDGAILKRLIDRLGFADAAKVVETYFASADPFIVNSGHGIGPLGSATTVNKLIAELSGRQGRPDPGEARAARHLAKVDSWAK